MEKTSVARIRRFNRAVTRESGVLDTSFLGRGRPLGPARVLNAVYAGVRDLDQVKRYLDLDKAVLSRFLRGLEADGLLTLEPDPTDGRKRCAVLTEEGRQEAEAYEALSNDRAKELLDRLPNPEILLQAMDLVASALGRDEVVIERVAPNHPDAVQCLERYYSELAQRLKNGFDVNLSCDPEAADMMPPRGAFFVAFSDGMPIGCVGLKGTDKGYAEVKRLWVSSSARGLGLAKTLMARLETEAKALSINLLRLDTNSALPEAVSFYQRQGWAEIDRFNDDPYPDYFFEKQI